MLNFFNSRTPDHSATVASIPLENKVSRTVDSSHVASRTIVSRGIERRRSRRLELESQLAVTTLDGTILRGYTRDFSREGAAAIIHGELTEGQEINLRFRSAGAIRDTAEHAIVRTKIGHRYGLEFVAENIGLVDMTAIPAHQASMAASGD